MQSTPRDNIFPFIRHEQVAKDAHAFFFNTSGKDFSFIPGQYIRIQLTLKEPDPRGNGRFFSLTTSPLQKDQIRIVTRVRGSVFKNTLMNLAPGSPVAVFGPVGRFTLDELSEKPLVFLAGGIGITPYLSIISYAFEKKLTIPMTLFASFSTVEDIIYYEQLQKIASINPSIKLVVTVTQPEASSRPWSGEVGRITPELIKKYVADATSAFWYISGPPVMVLAMEEMVKELAVPQEQMKKEQFTGY